MKNILQLLLFMSYVLITVSIRVPKTPLTISSNSTSATYFHLHTEAIPEETKVPKIRVEAVADGSDDLNDAVGFLDQFSKGMSSVATIASFFGPEGEAIGQFAKLVSGLSGLGDVLVKKPQKTDPNKVLAEKITTGFKDLAARLDTVSADVASIKADVIKAEIATLFAKPEQVLLTFTSSVQQLATNQTSVDHFLFKLKPYVVYSGDFTTSFGFIRDCIGGKNQACAVGGVPFVNLVGNALNQRPSEVVQFFAYYQMLLTNAASAYCAVEKALYPDDDCDSSYASSLPDFYKVVQTYVTAQQRDFMCSFATSQSMPPTIASIVKKYANQGNNGVHEISDEVEKELNTYYNPVNWYGYWVIMISDPHPSYHTVGSILPKPDPETCMYGTGGQVSMVDGYDVTWVLVPSHTSKPYYNASLTNNFASCLQSSWEPSRVQCVDQAATSKWFTWGYMGKGDYFYVTYNYGGTVPGGTTGICSHPSCGLPNNPVAIHYHDSTSILLQG